MMQTLYSLVDTDDIAKKNLYIRGNCDKLADGVLALKKGETLDFSTYFNSFSLKKWKRYTTLEMVRLSMALEGHFRVTFHVYEENGAPTEIQTESRDSHFEYSFSVKDLDGVILGFTLECLSDTGLYRGGEWQGQFSRWNEKKIGISITTFKREAYVKKTISVLQQFQKNHPWLSVLVVDNGSTLEEKQDKDFRLIHNRNFGGSGGFTRGMIEYMDQGIVDYVLLMDDDIVLEPSAIERTWTLLCGLQEEFNDSFLAGSMLSLEKPCIQSENTAYWNKIISSVFHQNLDISITKNLVYNERINNHSNAYAGWWYCCIPIKRIKEIGYPLPVFIKGDDIEYGIRNQREFITLNGIGVWHAAFIRKVSPLIHFFSDRNMLIVHHFVPEYGMFVFALAELARIIKRLIHGSNEDQRGLLLALKEYAKGFSYITSVPADKKMQEISYCINQEKISFLLIRILGNAFYNVLLYKKLSVEYKRFASENLKQSNFWKKYLGI